jgi:3-isopropylmalate/(R)-2-methylmalate dehydratase small subunit
MCDLIRQGRAWLFPANIAVDGELLPHTYVRQRLTDPQELAKHVFERIAPAFASEVQPGDLVVAGWRFGHGNPHAQGFRGLAATGIGLLTEWMPRGAYRCCVVAGLPFLPYCRGVMEAVSDGDQLHVDFRTGLVHNLTRQTILRYEPPCELLLDIVEAGGTMAHLKLQLAKRGIAPGQPEGHVSPNGTREPPRLDTAGSPADEEAHEP